MTFGSLDKALRASISRVVPVWASAALVCESRFSPPPCGSASAVRVSGPVKYCTDIGPYLALVSGVCQNSSLSLECPFACPSRNLRL